MGSQGDSGAGGQLSSVLYTHDPLATKACQGRAIINHWKWWGSWGSPRGSHKTHLTHFPCLSLVINSPCQGLSFLTYLPQGCIHRPMSVLLLGRRETILSSKPARLPWVSLGGNYSLARPPAGHREISTVPSAQPGAAPPQPSACGPSVPDSCC